jgi:hypothetical protein
MSLPHIAVVGKVVLALLLGGREAVIALLLPSSKLFSWQ